MKLLNKLNLIYLFVLVSVLTSCLQGDPMNTPPGGTNNLVSTAINSDGVWEVTPLAVAASSSEVQYDLILVTLSSPSGPASQDVHVQMVAATDSLTSYNTAQGTSYVMPSATGNPSFTLVDNGVVTIPKGSNVGYLKIKATSANFLGATSYAFAYRIASIQEAGYTVSTNNAYSITPFLVKNTFDGVYDFNITTTGWAGYGISDGVPGDYGNIALTTTGVSSCSFLNLVRGDNLQPAFTSAGAKTGFGATNPNFVFDSNNKIVNVFNSVPDDGRGRKFSINPSASSSENVYDPATKKIVVNYLMHQNGRPDMTVKGVMTYVGSR